MPFKKGFYQRKLRTCLYKINLSLKRNYYLKNNRQTNTAVMAQIKSTSNMEAKVYLVFLTLILPKYTAIT